MKNRSLSARLRKIFALLKKLQPIPDEIDVVWWGPYFLPRPGQWCPSHFTLYKGTLYSRLMIPPASYGLSWKLGSSQVEFEREAAGGDYDNNDYLWKRALKQMEQRLKSILKNVTCYNHLVEKRLPLSCRTGKIRRELTWPRDAKRPISHRQMQLLERVLGDAKNDPLLSEMTRYRYLKTTAIAYNTGFKELRHLSPLEKYKKKADGRHGGLLDLPQNDARAFHKWFHSRSWLGCHPWEIVFGHPHGIMISPRYHEGNRRWSYWMWVDSLGWYVTAARMAIALGKHKVPFELQNERELLEALQGCDEVDVGPDLYSVNYDDLKKQRPDALTAIRWDPIPQMSLITPDQSARIKQAELD